MRTPFTNVKKCWEKGIMKHTYTIKHLNKHWYNTSFLHQLWVFANENRANMHAKAKFKGRHAYTRKEDGIKYENWVMVTTKY